MKLIANGQVNTWATGRTYSNDDNILEPPDACRSRMLIAMILATLAGLSVPAVAQFNASKAEIGESKPFDPSACKTGDKKYVYWAAKDKVFRFNFDPNEPLYPRGWWVNQPGNFGVAQREVPPPPTPAEPEGCFGNPLRAGSAPYMDEFAKATYRNVFGREMLKAGHGGIENSYRATADGALWRYSSHGEISDKLIRKSKDCWARSNGLTECMSPQGSNRADYRINRYLKIDKAYLANQPQVADIYFFVSPGPYPWTQANGSDTRMAYVAVENLNLLFGAVGLDSSFYVFPTELEKMIPFYGALIQYVTTAHIPDYSWHPTSSTAPKRAK